MTASFDGNVVFDALDDARPLPNGAFALDTETGPVILSAAELVDIRARARTNADAAARKVEADLDVLIDAYAYQQGIDGSQPIAANASRVLGDVEPFETELRETLGYAKAALGRFRRLADNGELGAAAKELEAAEFAVRTADRAWAAVRDGLEGGAGEAIETLEHTRNAAALTVGVLAVVASGGAATALITGGAKTGAASTAMLANGIATAAPALAAAGEAGARLHVGLPVDWARLGKDAAMDVLLSRFGGRIANGVFDKLAGHPALRGMTRVAFARTVSTVLAHEGVTAVSTTVDHLFEGARGKPVTWAQLADHLVTRLTDPKGAAIAAVFGAVAAHRVDRPLQRATRVAWPKGKAEGPNVTFRKNADGPRSPEEALAIAKANGIDIPEDVKIAFVSDRAARHWISDDASAWYLFMGRQTGEELYTWDRLAVSDGNVVVKVRNSVLESDEAIVGILAHELYELGRLREIMDQRPMTSPELRRLLNTRADGGTRNNFHERAWDETNRKVKEMRERNDDAVDG